jgi:lysophospholipase L1-like esterase
MSRVHAVAVLAALAIAFSIMTPAHAVSVGPGGRPVGTTPSHAPVVELSSRKPGTSPVAVYVQGDSLTYGTLPYLARAMTAVGYRLAPTASAKVGRTVAQGLAITAATPRKPTTVLIALGTNDIRACRSTAASWVARARTIVGPTATLYWVNLKLTGSKFANQTNINDGLLAGVRADNARQTRLHLAGTSYILDWHAYATDAKIPNGSDGIHYGANYPKRATFYARAMAGTSTFSKYKIH